MADGQRTEPLVLEQLRAGAADGRDVARGDALQDALAEGLHGCGEDLLGLGGAREDAVHTKLEAASRFVGEGHADVAGGIGCGADVDAAAAIRGLSAEGDVGKGTLHVCASSRLFFPFFF